MKNRKRVGMKDGMPFGGVFIFSKVIKNDGMIHSEGKQAITQIKSEKYSGKGKVLAESTRALNGKWHQAWWGTIIIGISVTVIGGILLKIIL